MLRYYAAKLLDPAENILVQHNETTGEEPPHTHDFIELVYIAEGGGIQQVGTREYTVRRGNLLFLNCGEVHAFEANGHLEYYNILLRPEFMGEELIHREDAFSLLTLTAFEEFRGAAQEESHFCTFEGRELREIETAVLGMYREFERKDTGYRTILRGYLSVLLARLFRRMAIPENDLEYDKKSREFPPEILTYIAEHCCEKLSLSELARKCFYNPSYFSRVFKEYSGQSLTDFIGEKRMERAAELLENTEMTVEEIALAAGYGDKGQFYRQFKIFYGITPRAYRSKMRDIEKERG